MSACREVALAGNGPTYRIPPRSVVVLLRGDWDDGSLAIHDGGGVLDLANDASCGRFGDVSSDGRSQLPEPDVGVRTGATRHNEVPGVRTENALFGGFQDAGLGIEEGVIEFRKFMPHTQSFSLSWSKTIKTPISC